CSCLSLTSKSASSRPASAMPTLRTAETCRDSYPVASDAPAVRSGSTRSFDGLTTLAEGRRWHTLALHDPSRPPGRLVPLPGHVRPPAGQLPRARAADRVRWRIG